MYICESSPEPSQVDTNSTGTASSSTTGAPVTHLVVNHPLQIESVDKAIKTLDALQRVENAKYTKE
jgi:hypothetical protein